MIFFLFLLLNIPQAQADTLTFKDGSTLKGQYVGGTRLRLRFEVQNKIRHIPISEIASLSFENKIGVEKPTNTPTPDAPEKPTATRPEHPTPPIPNLRSTGLPQLTIPVKTLLTVQLTQDLNTQTNKRGDRFTVTLQEAIRQNRTTLVPANSKLYGRITNIQSIESDTAQIALELTSVNLDNHIYTLSTHRIEITCDGDIITMKKGTSAFDKQTELGDFITPNGNIRLPAQTRLHFTLATPLQLPKP